MSEKVVFWPSYVLHIQECVHTFMCIVKEVVFRLGVGGWVSVGKLLVVPAGNLSPIPRTQTKVEGKNFLHRVVL